jgi:hypothetical protein
MKACLKHISRVVKHPLLISEGGEPRVLTTGAHNGIFVDSSDVVPEMPLSEAVPAILDLFCDFKFNTPNDFSRAVAHLLSPAMVFGNLLSGRVPMHVVQADHPGSGKGFMQKLILTIYNENPGLITNITKGVGGIGEILSSRLMEGYAFIQYDNWRGKLVSEMLESGLTEDFASCRKLHAEAIVSTRGAFFMLTSNGAEVTPDLADRCSFVRITKQPDDYKWHWEGDELIERVKDRRAYYLGCVYSALSQWIREGKPKTSAAGIHRFRQWAACMDWLVQNLFSLPPLLDGHRQVQKEVASDILTFLRQVAIKVEQEGQLGEEFIASALVELAQRHHVTIPGIKDATDENAHKSLGRQMGRCFRDGDTLALDSSFQIVRKATSVKRDDGNGYNPGKAYVFFRTTADPGSSSGPFNSGNPSNGQKPGPASSCGGEEQATTAETTAEPLLNENTASTVVTQPAHHQGVTEQKTSLPLVSLLNIPVFAEYKAFNAPAGGNALDGKIGDPSAVSAVVISDNPAQVVSQPGGKIAFTLIRKKSELAHIADTLAGTSEPLAIDLETYNNHNRPEDNLSPFKGEIRLLSIKAPQFPAWLIDLKEISYDLAELKEVLENQEVITHHAAFDTKFLKAKCGLNLKGPWCTMTAAKLLSNGLNELKNDLGSVLERHLLLKLPKDQGASDSGKPLTEDQYQYAANDVEYLHALKQILEEELTNHGMTAVFQQESAVIPIAVDMELTGFQGK